MAEANCYASAARIDATGDDAPSLTDLVRAWIAAEDAAKLKRHRCEQIDGLAEPQEYDRLDREADNAWRPVNTIGTLIADRQPMTVGEAALKFHVLLKWCSDGDGGFDDPEPVKAFLSDLQYLALVRP